MVLSGSKPERKRYRKRWKPPGESLSPGNTVPIRNFLRKESDLAKIPSGKRKKENEHENVITKKIRVGTPTKGS